MPFDRASGILLHPTSLPSRGGIGNLGPAAHEFVDFLARAKQHLWQVLPLCSLGTGNSPYSATSAFAGNPLLISLERLAERGWLKNPEMGTIGRRSCHVDFAAVQSAKLPRLREAAERFLSSANGDFKKRFEEFCWLN